MNKKITTTDGKIGFLEEDYICHSTTITDGGYYIVVSLKSRKEFLQTNYRNDKAAFDKACSELSLQLRPIICG
jgi:hypothetical protein